MKEYLIENGYTGGERMIRMMHSMGWIQITDKKREDNLWLDIIAANGDILHEWPITKGGFEYLRRTYKCVWERLD